MFSVFYREDVDNMFCIMKLIDNAAITDSQRELSFMIADEWFSALWVFRKRRVIKEQVSGGKRD